MPYKTDPLSMVIFLPKERNGLAGIEQKISMAMVRSVLCDFEKNKPEKVMLTLPKFRIEFGSGLKSAFQTLGMKLAFSDQADFGGITGRENTPGLIWIGQIQHKAFIEINEEGSEAAAATGVEFITKSISPKITRFNVDHPFLFLLMDKTTGAILFMGRVNNPLES
jgi:serpin B